MAVVTGETAFFGKTYGEAMSLLVEARDYLAAAEPGESRALAPLARLALCTETTRLSARLTRIMAWLLMERAVHAGEIGRAAAPDQPLAACPVCMAGIETGLPPRLADLLGRSRRLYVRVARLDELTRRGA